MVFDSPRHVHIAYRFMQPIGDLPQELIAHIVPPTVIHRLETVEVQEHQGKVVACMTAMLDRDLQPLQQQRGWADRSADPLPPRQPVALPPTCFL